MSSHSTHVRMLVPLAALALLMLLPGAAAQSVSNIGVTLPSDAVEVMPGAGPGMIHGNVTYQCGTTINEITLTATSDAGGTVGTDPATISPDTLPTCTPDQTPAAPFAVTFEPGMDQIAGTEVPVEVVASTTIDPAGAGDPEQASGTATFLVGPYVEVTFTPNITTIDAAAGDEVPVSVMVESKSNTLVMAMPSVGELPATWERPSIPPRNIPTPLEDGEDGMASLDFIIKIPADAEGTVTMDLTLFAHSLTDTYAQTEETTISYTINIAPGATTPSDGDDSEESPAFPVTALVLAGVALLAIARRAPKA